MRWRSAATTWRERLARTGRGIKPTLMDQKVLAGIGNIYADEILFRARLHPERIAARLSAREVDRLHAAIGEVLAEAIAAEGSSFDAGYRTVLGLEGGFLAQNAMYGRGGKPCPSCGSAILKTRIAGLIGRPTHFCPDASPSSRRGGRPGDEVRIRRVARVPVGPAIAACRLDLGPMLGYCGKPRQDVDGVGTGERDHAVSPAETGAWVGACARREGMYPVSYRTFKHLLGETSLERKCRFIFGGGILVLVTSASTGTA